MERDGRDLAQQAALSSVCHKCLRTLMGPNCFIHSESLHWLCGQRYGPGRGHDLWSNGGFSVGPDSGLGAVQVKGRAWGFACIPRSH